LEVLPSGKRFPGKGRGEGELKLPIADWRQQAATPLAVASELLGKRFPFRILGWEAGKQNGVSCLPRGGWNLLPGLPFGKRAKWLDDPPRGWGLGASAGQEPVTSSRSGIAIDQIEKERVGGNGSRFETFVHVQMAGRNWGPGARE
jgi:hypothetical protein